MAQDEGYRALVLADSTLSAGPDVAQWTLFPIQPVCAGFTDRLSVSSWVMDETTLVLIKPGGVSRNLIGEITRRVEARGLRITGLKLVQAARATVEEHYAEHKERPFFKDVCDYLTSGPIVCMAVTGTNAVKAIRAMMGATNPLDATPGTVRGDLALTIDDNLTHSSSDDGAAERELKLWFPEGTVR